MLSEISQKDVFEKLKELKPILFQKFNVVEIGFFGSFATNDFTEKSDIDILVHFGKPIGWEFFDLQDFLYQHFQRKIDLVSKNALKFQLKEKILNQTIFI